MQRSTLLSDVMTNAGALGNRQTGFDFEEPPPPYAGRIFRYLVAKGPATAKDFTEHYKLAPTTVARAVSWLRQNQLIAGDASTKTQRHRRSSVFRPAPGNGFLGIHIAETAGRPTQLTYVVTDLAGAPIQASDFGDDSGRASLPRERPIAINPSSPGELVQQVAKSVNSIRSAWASVVTMRGIGVSVTGPVSEGRVRVGPQLLGDDSKDTPPGGVPFEFERHLASALDLPVVVDNDVTALTVKVQLAEHSTLTSCAIVAVGLEGIGGGLICHGKVWRGAHGLALEPGHQILPRPKYLADDRLWDGAAPDDGRGASLTCRCGHRDCLEAFATPAVMLNALQRLRSDERQTGPSIGQTPWTLGVATSVSDRDEDAVEVFSQSGNALGTSLANIINTVDPAIIRLYAPPELLVPPRRSAIETWYEGVRKSTADGAFRSHGEQLIEPRPVALLEMDELFAEGAAALLVEGLLETIASRRRRGDFASTA
jgi:predicted NBD/HSP70 family sugar kinase